MPDVTAVRTIQKITFSMIILTLAIASPPPPLPTTIAALPQHSSIDTRRFSIPTPILSTPLTIFKGLSRQAASSLSIPFGQLAGLDLLNKHASSEILGSADAVLMGARDFISPTGAGSAGHPGLFCFIVVFGKQPMPDFGKYFTQTPSSPAAGAHVWQWVADIYDIPPALTFYAIRSAALTSCYRMTTRTFKGRRRVGFFRRPLQNVEHRSRLVVRQPA